MIYKSIWLEDVYPKKQKALNENIETDVLIIGGGITGITTAYALRNQGLSVCLVERNYIGSGVTSKTTGKLTYLQERIYTKLQNEYNYQTAKLYLQSQKKAIQLVKEIIQKEEFDCSLEKVTSYVFTDKETELQKLKKEYTLLKKMGVNVKEHQKLEIGLNSIYAISVEDTYVFHPLKYINNLKKICKKEGIQIYEDTTIQKIKRNNNLYICSGEKFSITAKQVVLACHYPYFIFPYLFPIKTSIETSYITASPVLEDAHTSYITSKNPTKSIRYYNGDKKYCLYLSNSHKLGNHINKENQFDKTIKEAKELYLSPKYVWSNEDIITYDHLPFIGEIKENLFIATGYNTWGMTNGTFAGFLLKDLILHIDNPYKDMFNPKRKNLLAKTISYPMNIFQNSKSYIQNKIKKQKKWYPQNLKFETINGKSIAIYSDEQGIHKVYTNCPHMGCTLLFNEKEHTWDCPCHASKFDIDGKCIKGPSTKNITYKEK